MGSGLAFDSILDSSPSSDFGSPFEEGFEFSSGATDFSLAESEVSEGDFSPHPISARAPSSNTNFFMIPES